MGIFVLICVVMHVFLLSACKFLEVRGIDDFSLFYYIVKQWNFFGIKLSLGALHFTTSFYNNSTL